MLSGRSRQPCALTFTDANILFRMFAVTPARMEDYNSKGTSGSKSLDYAIDIMAKLPDGDYSTSELALLEACGVASRESGRNKSISLLEAALEQEGLTILEAKALAYPLAFCFVLEHGLEARDALHLGIAVISRVSTIATSDREFADGIEGIRKGSGIRIPTVIEAMYGLSEQEALVLSRNTNAALSNIEVERAPG